MKFWRYFYPPGRHDAAALDFGTAHAVSRRGKGSYGIGSIEQMLQAAGVPGWFGYAVYIGQGFAPLLLVGLWVVPAALIVAINMLLALVLVLVLVALASVFALARERRLGAGIADFAAGLRTACGYDLFQRQMNEPALRSHYCVMNGAACAPLCAFAALCTRRPSALVTINK